MPRIVKVAATQLQITQDKEKNLDKAEEIVRAAAADGANIILLQELFEHWYYGQEQNPEYFAWAKPLQESQPVQRMSALARELNVVLPVSFYECANNVYFNSLAMIDADGSMLGVYRKSHIADNPGYMEKFYYSPGDTGFKVFDTQFGRIGAAVCWDQWFPEAARVLAIQGAEVIIYPSAIGSEPTNPDYCSYPHWTRTMLGHAAANLVPIVVSNRIGTETFSNSSITFYGGSFIAGHYGEVLKQVGVKDDDQYLQDGNFHPNPEKIEGYVIQEFDFDECRQTRVGWAVFRDRRPELYTPLLTYDGKRKHFAT